MARNRKNSSENKPKRRSTFGYYRPTNRVNLVDNETNKSSSIGNFLVTAKRVFQTLLRNVFLIAIAVIILFNTTISGASVKVLDSQREDSYRSLEEYNQGVQSLINESIFNKSKLTLRTLSFEDKIRDKFPEVTEASVVVPLAGRKLQVGLTFDEPFLRLRTDDNGQQGIVGESGRLMLLTDTNFVLERFSSVPSISLDPSVSFSIGDQALTSVEVALLRLVMSEFDGSQKFRPLPESVVFKVDKREVEVRFKGVGYYAKLTPEREARSQIGSLIASLERLEEEGSTPKEYIDVRVDDRVFTK